MTPNLLQAIGANTLSIIAQIGMIFKFMLQSLWAMCQMPIYVKLLGKQLINVGYFSLPVIGLTTLFSGMVMALQTYSGFSGIGAEATIPRVVSIAMVRELAPVLSGLMLAGRVGAAMTAELGTMRVTEQIDAMYTLAINPMRYLVVPRILACTIAMPLLVAIGDILGIYGGYLIAVYKLDLSASNYIDNVLASVQYIGVVSGLTKAAVFGFIIGLVGCFFGFNSEGGAAGVGVATTSTVVISSILILMLNLLITELFFLG